MKLFALYVGGRAPKCLIELHDVMFVAANRVEDTYGAVRSRWFGSLDRIHLDCYAPLTWADGYNIRLSEQVVSAQGENLNTRLFFVNFGAYRPELFTEIHLNAFVVASDASSAVKRARESLNLKDFVAVHVDDKVDIEREVLRGVIDFDADDVVELSEVDGYSVILEPNPQGSPVIWSVGYHKIPK